MNTIFYIAAAVAVLATLRVIIHTRAVHALLYFIVSLLAIAVVFYTLGAPMAAALEVIVYAGAIMVLFVFVVMMLNLGPEAARQERQWLSPRAWVGPAILAAVLLAEVVYLIAGAAQGETSGWSVDPANVGGSLFGPYMLGVELASMLLLAGLVGAYHLGRRDRPLPPPEKEVR
jgi:NADH-quinone oxidoreductase subunit J